MPLPYLLLCVVIAGPFVLIFGRWLLSLVRRR